jgi:hypothetical protein
MAGQVGKRIHRRPACGVPGGRISVVNLALQGTRHGPHPQPSRSGAMPDDVGGQLVNGQDDLRGPALRQPGLYGESLSSRPEHVQRA